MESPPSPTGNAHENGAHVTPLSLAPAPRTRLGMYMVIMVCVLSVGFLVSMSGVVRPVSWGSTTELQQSIKFLQDASPSPPSISPSSPSPATTVSVQTAVRAMAPAEDDQRGIVMCLHNKIASMGASLIRELRCLGNTEPIHVYHCLPDELSEESRALLTRNDSKVQIIDVCTEYLAEKSLFNGDMKKAKNFRNYWIKPLALYHTRLQEVILLDADAILLRDPADLRSKNAGYNRTGTIFFHDRIHKMPKFFNAPLANGEQTLRYILRTFDYKRFGILNPKPSPQLLQSYAYKQESGHEMDSSLVFIDKRRAGNAMNVLLYLIMELRMKVSFSWGDKEAFWLAYELAQQDYFFSPWGLSLVDSVPNDDLKKHPTTLCGSMAHFMPTEDENAAPEILYVNGKALLDPFAVAIKKMSTIAASRLYNVNPTHVTPRYKYSTFDLKTRKTFECLDTLGSTPLPKEFPVKLLRRRLHYFAAETKVFHALDRCDL